MSTLQQHIVTLASQGWRTPKIVARLGLAKPFVIHCLASAPKPARKSSDYNKTRRARGDVIRAAILADPSKPTRDLAREFGVSKPRISALRRQVRNLEKTQ